MKDSRSFQELLEQTRQMATSFENVEQRPWGIEGAMIELSKQVGDLAKRVMTAEKYYLKARERKSGYAFAKEDIADEIFDIWFCLVRIADYYQIDFEHTIDATTKLELERFQNGEITRD